MGHQAEKGKGAGAAAQTNTNALNPVTPSLLRRSLSPWGKFSTTCHPEPCPEQSEGAAKGLPLPRLRFFAEFIPSDGPRFFAEFSLSAMGDPSLSLRMTQREGFRMTGSEGLSNCLACQALNAEWSCHRVRDLSIAFRMVSSFRIQAVSATFFALPAAQRGAGRTREAPG